MRASQLLGFLLLLCGVLGPTLWAQDPTAPLRSVQQPEGPGELTIDAIETDLERIRTDADLDESTRARLLELFGQALAQVQRRNEWVLQHDVDVQAQLEAPAQLTAIRAQLALEPPEENVEAPADATFSQLQQLLGQAEADLAAANKLVSDYELDQRDRTERRSELPTRLSEARGRLLDVEVEIAAFPQNEAQSEQDRALRLSVLARRAALQAEIRAYEQELSSFDVLDELLIARRTQASRRVGQADRRVKAWRERVNQQRRVDSEADAMAAQEALETTARDIDILKPLADYNSELAERRFDDIGLKIEAVTASRDEITEQLSELQDRFATVQAKYAAAGGTPTIGLLLKDHRDRLLDVQANRAAREERLREQGDIELQKIDYEEQAKDLVDLDEAVDDFIESLETVPVDSDRAVLELGVREQLQIRQGILTDLLADYRTYLRELIDLSIVEKKLIDETDAFAEYIEERVLWVRIAPPLHTAFFESWQKTTKAVAWLFDGQGWGEVIARLPVVIKRNPLGLGAQVLMLILLLATRPFMQRRIADDAYMLGRIRTDRFSHTVRTTLLTTLLAAGPALVVWFAASLLDQAAGVGLPLGRSIAAGLRVAAVAYVVAEFLWTVCRRRGLAEAHFRWPVVSLKLMRRHIRWLMLFGLPLVFVIGSLEAQGNSAYTESLGRLAFMVGQLLLAVFVYQVLRPTTGVLRFTLERNPGSWTSRLRWMWFPAALGMPLVLFGIAFMGYLYTAQQLQIRMQLTAMIILGLVLVHALLMRWLFVARRQLGLQQHRKRLAAAQAEGGSPSSLSDEYADEQDIDIPSVSAQSQRFVQVFVGFGLVAGILLVWVGVLPALNYFDDAVAWEHWVDAVGQDGETETRLDPVTLLDLLVALATLLATVAAARNLPGLLEISILRRLPLQRAGRYAITTISRYLISVIGIALMFGRVGISWETVQWLAAAVSVGLGFGLQEIFANFVSGLILLFERPIRVGDTVTVGEVTGTVTRIHMRATTIVTWDRTELIVPNREFITSQLVNWTLSDSVLRVIIKVGIAYGSDINKAEELLRKVASELPDVLDEPAPRIVFTQFGDSTLDFELRVFVTDPELFRTISHPLNSAIDREFRAAGIEIAFPQRELHIRSSSVPIPYIPTHAIEPRPRGQGAPA